MTRDVQKQSCCDARDESVCSMMAGMFRGRQCWLTCIAWIDALIFTIIAVISAVKFFGAETTDDKLLWLGVFLTSVIVIALVKLWCWGMMARNTIIREIRRLEDRISERRQPADQE